MAEGMVVVMDGDDLPPEEFGAEHGWRSAAVKKNALRVSRRDSTREAASSEGHRARLNGSRKPTSLKHKIIKSSRMPQLPKEHWKIIARPRGGLDVQKTGSARLGRAVAAAAGLTSEQASHDIVCPNATQNIIVLSTASRDNADAYLKMNCITLGMKQYELSTYEAAPHATCKGVIRQIDVSESQADLDRSILNERNPLALGAKRIKNSETVVIVFDGYKVPNFVFYGSALVKCSLYLRQHDCCYACGRLATEPTSAHRRRTSYAGSVGPTTPTTTTPARLLAASAGPARHSGQDLQAKIPTPVHRSAEEKGKKSGIQESRPVTSTDKRRQRTG